VIVPWYATGFRADRFEEVLNDLAAVALRYGATSYAVYRARDDRYKFQQLANFAEHIDWERFWDSPQMTDFRANYQGWYQVPVLYGWWDCTAAGAIAQPSLAKPLASSNGHTNGSRTIEGESA
jgi:hypothetical protein